VPLTTTFPVIGVILLLKQGIAKCIAIPPHFMLTKINRQTSINQYPVFPLRTYNAKKEEDDFSYPKTFSSYVLTLPSKSWKGHIKLLGAAVADLTKQFGADTLIFLGDSDIPWLYGSHDFKQAKEALQYLFDKKIGKKFNGAIQVELAALPVFIQHLTWLVRTNAISSYVHFIDPQQNILGTICQYGNLHLYALNKKVTPRLKELISRSIFQYVKDEICVEKFSVAGVIKGRQMTI